MLSVRLAARLWAIAITPASPIVDTRALDCKKDLVLTIKKPVQIDWGIILERERHASLPYSRCSRSWLTCRQAARACPPAGPKILSFKLKIKIKLQVKRIFLNKEGMPKNGFHQA